MNLLMVEGWKIRDVMGSEIAQQASKLTVDSVGTLLIPKRSPTYFYVATNLEKV